MFTAIWMMNPPDLKRLDWSSDLSRVAFHIAFFRLTEFTILSTMTANILYGEVMPQDPHSFHEFMPADVWRWKMIEHQVDQVLDLHDYEEIRLSVLQDYTVLYQGLTALMQEQEAKDAVSKTINLCGPNDDISLISLRPEGTISVLHHTARVFIPGEVHRFYYHGPMFRLDKDKHPLEFYQLGVELLGSETVLSENEVISLGIKLCESLGLADVKLRINSYGCKDCRRDFFEAVESYLDEHQNDFCTRCYQSLRQNPFEDVRCQDPRCRQLIQEGPRITDFLCSRCKEDFGRIKKIQANLGHRYTVDPFLYKNFSYYNETVFDFVLGSGDNEVTIGGGGRYDDLSELITGKRIPAVGFYLNMDLVFSVLKQRGLFNPLSQAFSVYLCAQSPDMEMMLLQIAHELHESGIRTVLGIEQDALDIQIRKARGKQCALLFAIREDNIRDGKILLHNLAKEHQEYIPLAQVGEAVLLARKALNQE